MSKFQRLLSAFVAAATVLTSVGTGAFANTAEDDLLDLHWGTCVATDEPSEYGYVDFKTIDENGDEVFFNLKSDAETAYRGTLPAKYSLVDKGYLPAVRNQGSEGSCWAHAGMAMAESNMIMNGLAKASTVDFSEKHLCWFAIGANAPSGDPLYGDFSGLGAKVAYDDGGNFVDVMFTLMAWIGVEQESAVPYKDFTSGVAESYRYHSYGHLTNANKYDNSDTTAIKQAIMRDGAVQIAYYASGSYLTSASQNTAKFAAYYCPTSYKTNHSITVVGWDDNFSKSNFKAGGTPTSNGAWLCRNSWGSTWGTNGYFYMSYEDKTVKQFTSITMESASNYGKVYQYDGGCHHKDDGYIYSYNYISGTGLDGGANVFTATADDEIAAVSYFTPAAGWNYTIKVYNNLTGSTPRTGKLAATVSGKTDYYGYHTVKLPNTVAIKKGSKFAVAIDLYTSSGTHYLVTDLNNPASGRSFLCSGSSWDDMKNYESRYDVHNVRVKAYTKGQAAAPGKPTNVKATPGNGQVTVTWDKLTGATKYKVVAYNSASAVVYSVDTTDTTAIVTGLESGTKYGFLVRALVNGAWVDSDIVYATTNGVSKPVVTATPGDSRVRITWTSVTGATKYKYFVYDNTDTVFFSATITDTATTAAAIKNLTPGMKYGFLVRALVNGAWVDSDIVYATPTGVVKPVVTATPGDSRVRISWTGVPGATKYKYFVYDNTDTVFFSATITDTATTAAAIKNLTPGMKYGFLVRALVNGAWVDSDIVYATPTGIARPIVKATPGDGRVRISWTSVPNATKYKYFVYDNTDTVFFSAAITDTATTAAAVKNLTNGMKYGFLVRALVNGAWVDSEIVYATPNA